jgi:superfamily I DNA/RNA helicase
MSCAIEDVLVRESFPYVIYGSRGFYNRKEIKDIVNILKSSVDPVKYQKSLTDSINIASNEFKTPTRFLGKKFIKMINDYAEQERISFFSAINKGDYRCPYLDSRQGKGVEDLILFLNRIKAIDDFVEKIKYIKDNSYARYMRRNIDTDLDNPSDDRLACIDELIRSAYNFRDVHSFIEHTERAQELSSQKEDDENFDGIRCMTIHKSKGLEFDTVFSIGLQENSLPSYYALEDGDISEERRLAYVAFTRAKKNLHVSYAGKPSRFLYESGLLKLKCASEDQK